MPVGVVTSPTPFRMVSRPAHLRGASQTVLTKKNYDEAEKELRNVYPQYGGLVERPKFKQKMDEWLEEQRIRAAHRKMLHKKNSYSEVRQPSYEGNGYHEEISLTNLHSKKVCAVAGSGSSDKAPSKPRSRLPAPIKTPPPYVGQLCIASNDTYPNDALELKESVPWPDEPPPRPVAWPGFETSPPRPSKAVSDFAPPIPVKSPERWTSKRGQQSEQPLRDETVSHEMMRIVSKENIRAALGNLTPESSIEDLRAQAAHAKKAPTRVASPPRLETYNNHMFPRKDASSQGKST
jgi:hypothetical protein